MAAYISLYHIYGFTDLRVRLSMVEAYSRRCRHFFPNRICSTLHRIAALALSFSASKLTFHCLARLTLSREQVEGVLNASLIKAQNVDTECFTHSRRTPSTCSHDNVSLARQWNVSLEAEKDRAKAAMRWRVEQILLGKKCRHRRGGTIVLR